MTGGAMIFFGISLAFFMAVIVVAGLVFYQIHSNQISS
jgi:hypothetical protein